MKDGDVTECALNEAAFAGFAVARFASLMLLRWRLSPSGDRRKRPSRQGEVDLMFIRGKWYLACVCDIADPEEIRATNVLGVDFGMVNLATDTGGAHHAGETVETVRRRQARRRAGLRRRGTKAAKRQLRKLAGTQQRFQRHENHCISTAIVLEAQRCGRGIGREALKGIRGHSGHADVIAARTSVLGQRPHS